MILIYVTQPIHHRGSIPSVTTLIKSYCWSHKLPCIEFPGGSNCPSLWVPSPGWGECLFGFAKSYILAEALSPGNTFFQIKYVDMCSSGCGLKLHLSLSVSYGVTCADLGSHLL